MLRRPLVLAILVCAALAAPAEAATVTAKASQDTYVRADQPTSAFGTQTLLQVDGVPVRRTLLRFDAPASPNGVTGASLRVHVDFSTGQGYQVNASSCAFDDATTYNTAPAPGAVLASRASDPLGPNDFTLPASTVPTEGGQVCFQVTKTGDFWGNLRSREHTAGAYAPQLTITQADPPPPPACSNTLDDDADGLVDLNDPGCADATDDDESNVVTPPPPSAESHSATPNPALEGQTIQFAIQGVSCPAADCTFHWQAVETPVIGTPDTITWQSATPSSSRTLPVGRWNIFADVRDPLGQAAGRINPHPLTLQVNAAPQPTADLFVSPTGSSTSGCTQAAPCTPARANAIVTPGQVISVACGAYGPVSMTRGGTASARVTWVATQRRCARFSATSVCSGSAVSMSAQHVTVRGFEVTRGRVSVAITGSNTSFIDNWVHDVFLGCTPTGSGAAAIDAFTSNYVPMANVTIDRNLVHSVGRTPVGQAQTTQGIYIASPCPGCPVTNNVVWGVEDFGIHGYHNACNWKIVNNTSVGNGRGILVGPQSIRRNNISAFNRGNGWQVSSATSCSGGVPSANTSNNTSFGNGNNNAATGITVADPLFVNHPGRDYHLQPGSPAVDTGTATDAPPVDHAGQTRPQGAGFDRGAYER